METTLEVREIKFSCKHLLASHPQMFDDIPHNLEGDMNVPSRNRNTSQPGAPDFNTLDEPIKETIVRLFETMSSP